MKASANHEANAGIRRLGGYAQNDSSKGDVS